MRKLPTVPIKGKEYVMVKDRVTAFREDYPKGGISTEILDLTDGRCVIRATVTDDNGQLLATGIAYECGFCGYGIDDSLGSANEVANAMLQQEAMKDLATDSEKATFRALCGKAGVDPHDVLKAIGWKGGLMTKAQHGQALAWLKERGMI